MTQVLIILENPSRIWWRVYCSLWNEKYLSQIKKLNKFCFLPFFHWYFPLWSGEKKSAQHKSWYFEELFHIFFQMKMLNTLFVVFLWFLIWFLIITYQYFITICIFGLFWRPTEIDNFSLFWHRSTSGRQLNPHIHQIPRGLEFLCSMWPIDKVYCHLAHKILDTLKFVDSFLRGSRFINWMISLFRAHILNIGLYVALKHINQLWLNLESDFMHFQPWYGR
jgi:hypothetical protein